MEKNSIENAFLDRLEDCKLESCQTGGMSNEQLWSRIVAKSSASKMVAFHSSKKLFVVLGVGVSLACAAMYSGVHYYQSYTNKVVDGDGATMINTSRPVVNKAIAPIEPEIVENEIVVDDISANTVSSAPVSSLVTTQPKTQLVIKHVGAEEVAEKVISDRSVETLAETALEDESATEHNDALSQATDTALVEKITVYLKPAPVTVQTEKVKYVKKKRKRSE